MKFEDEWKVGCVALFLITFTNILFWGTVAYIALHFIMKVW